MSGVPTPTVRPLASADELELLRPLWLELHHHHRRISQFRGLVADDETSWVRRRELYRTWLEEGSALILLAEQGAAVIGYATVHFVDGADDTFAVGDRYAELYSLSVTADRRGAGIGSLLMDEIDARLAAADVSDLAVSVMAGNADAQRFYERRGMEPAEVVLWRLGNGRR
jgi:ribosomal protein S18 acetylase RimI-like enzyme